MYPRIKIDAVLLTYKYTKEIDIRTYVGSNVVFTINTYLYLVLLYWWLNFILYKLMLLFYC